MRSRRDFLKTALLAGGAWSVGGPLAAEAKPARFRFPIIDAHTHFYDPTRPQGVPWPDKNDRLLYRKVMPADYKALPTPHPVAGTVVVEASAWVEDNQWILDLAAHERFIVGFVGHLDPASPNFGRDLRRFAKHRLFRGIRLGADVVLKNNREPEFQRKMRALAERDLALDIVGGPETLEGAAALARGIPELRIVIDHLAGVVANGKTPAPSWTNGVARASEYPNVFCKVSGLVEGTARTDGTAPADYHFYEPILDQAWSFFGPRRLIYASNWPVSARFAPCGAAQKIIEDYFGGKGERPLAAVLYENSRGAYQWKPRLPQQKPG